MENQDPWTCMIPGEDGKIKSDRSGSANSYANIQVITILGYSGAASRDDAMRDRGKWPL